MLQPPGTLAAVRCRVCGAREVELVLDLGDQPHCNSLTADRSASVAAPRYPLRFGICRACTTAQIDHTVPKETMFSDYRYVSGTTRALREHFDESAARAIEKLDLARSDLVVDIGSNDGTWLSAFKARGMNVLGVEPAANLASLANDAGVPTLCEFFNEDVAVSILAEGRVPRLVTAAGVFFHLEELHSVTAGIARMCREGATFCVQAIYLGQMVRHTEFDNIYHEHLTYWTLRSIEALFAQHNLEVVDVGQLPIHGGTFELLVASAGARPVSSTVHALRGRELAEGLGEVETYRRFGERVEGIRTELVRILTEFKATQRTVYAFGAPAKGATLLNSFGIASDLVELAVEANPLKVGRYVPGAAIHIVEEGSVPEPDAFLILPWNFLPEFLEKRRDYILGGGSFIVPIPAPFIVDSSNYAATLDAHRASGRAVVQSVANAG